MFIMITRRITFRLYPSKSQEAKLHYWRKLHKDLYNACLYQRKIEYKKFGRNINYYDQQNALPAFKECWPEYKELGSHALQATVKRVDVAFQRFFQGLGKYPRFKSARHYRGFTYPCIAGWKALSDGKNGHLMISKLGKIQMRGQARTWGEPTTCTIFWQHGKWYASISVKCKPTRETGTGAVGLDFGTYHAIATSEGTFIDNPRFLGYSLKEIKELSKRLRRKRSPNKKKRIKASKRWRKARSRISVKQRKLARQRKDWQHKVTSEIVASNSLVVTEQLNLKGMTRKAKKGKRKKQKTGLNRSLLDVGISEMIAMLEYKLSEGDGVFLLAPTRKIKPSQTCPKCNHQRKKDLSERVHNCEKCSYRVDRDVAAAQVMLNWAMGVGSLIIADVVPLFLTLLIVEVGNKNGRRSDRNVNFSVAN